MSTWIKLHDNFFDHPKVVGLTPTAITIYLRGLCYASHHLTDGYIPEAVIASWGINKWRAAVEQLCSEPTPRSEQGSDKVATRSLWSRSDLGYEIHDYLDYQRSAQEARKLSQKRASAGSKGGVAKASKAKQIASNLPDAGLAEKRREEPSSSPPTTDGGNLDTAAAYGGEDELFTATFALMAHFDLERAKADGVTIHTSAGFLNAATERRREEHGDDARHHLANHPTGRYYPLHVELAELLDPTTGPDDGGLARANAIAENDRLAREAEAAARGPRSNSGAAAARAALALHPDQGAA